MLIVFPEVGLYKMQVNMASSKGIFFVEGHSPGGIKILRCSQLLTDPQRPVAGNMHISVIKVQFGRYGNVTGNADVVTNRFQTMAVEFGNVRFFSQQAIMYELADGLIVGRFFPVIFQLPEYGLFPIAPFCDPDVPDQFTAPVLRYRHYDVLIVIAGSQYPVPVDPSMPDVLHIIA